MGTPGSRPRVSLTDVEATAVQVALYRYRGAAGLLRPDGLPYYDPSYDKALVDACLSEAEQERLTSGHLFMVGVMPKRTAEIDFHILRAVLGTASSGLGPTTTTTTTSSSAASASAGASSTTPTGSGATAGAGHGGGGGAPGSLCDEYGNGGGTGGGVRQVVLVGAGLDPRAWRLPFPRAGGGGGAGASTGTGTGVVQSATTCESSNGCEGATASSSSSGAAAPGQGPCETVAVFELDSGAVEDLKTEVLGTPSGCRRVFVRADLAQAEQAMAALEEAGHDASQPSVFVVEGLIGYLTVEAGDSLLRCLRSRAAPGSRLVLTAPPRPSWRDELAAQGVRLHHVTFEEPGTTLDRAQAQGWDAQLISAEALARKYRLESNTFTLIVGSS